MNLKQIIFYATILLVTMGCSREAVPESVEEEVTNDMVQAIVPGEAIVLFSEEMMELVEDDLNMGNVETKSAELNGLKQQLGVASMTRVFPHAGEFEPRTRAEGLHRWYKLTFDPSVPVTKASDEISSIPGVELVEPVRNVRNTAMFDDPREGEQWHYYNPGTKDGFSAGADINVSSVWESYTTGNPDVIVCVVDGGIDYSHEDLAANYVGGYNFVSGTRQIVAHDHGTHVAGTIAAVNNNGLGVCGVAGGDYKNGVKGVGLLSSQIFEHNPDDPTTDLSADGAAAIKWGADNGAVISQNSWGYVYETAEEQAAATIPTHLKAAIDYFIKNAGMDANGKQVGPMAGGIVIFAAGNDAREHDPIGKYDEVLSVGSIGPDFLRASYSNYGDWVDIAAPGGDGAGTVLSTLPNNAYGWMQGTSMACPHVSGVAALILSHHGGQGFTPDKLREKLVNGANSSVMSKNAKIGPLVDALGAITYGGTTPPVKVSEAAVSSQSNNITLSWKVTSDPDDNKAWGYRLLVSKDKAALSAVNPSSPEGSISYVDVLVGSLKVGEQMTGVISGLDFDEQYHVTVASFDYRRNWSAISPVYEVYTEENNPPVVTTSYDGSFDVRAHEVLKVTYEIYDPDGHKISVDYRAAGTADTLLPSGEAGKYELTIQGNADEPGEYSSVIKVADNYGLEQEHVINFLIHENHAPAVVKDVEDMFFDYSGAKFTLDMSEYIEDPDGEQLTYAINIGNKSVLHINPSDNILHATVLMFGTTDVTIVATDSRGLTSTLVFNVIIKDPSKPLEVYPNPVTDWLNISTLDVEPTEIVIVSSTGQTLFDTVQDVGAVEPARIDMSGFAPGRYHLTVVFGGTEYERTIVKL